MSSVSSNVVSVLDNGSLGLSRQPFSAFTPIDGLGSIQGLISTNRYSWSRDSKLLVIAGAQYVQVFSAADVVSSASNSAELLFTLDEQAVQYIEISPRALWLVTWRKPVDEQDRNAAVWCLRSGKCLLRRRRKVLDVSSNGVPFQFDVNESVVWFLQGSEVLGFDLSGWLAGNGGADGGQEEEDNGADELKYSWRLHVAGITRFWLAPSKSRKRMLVLMPGRKGAPSRVSVHEAPDLDTAINSKSFFHADMVSVNWNTPGNCALVQATAAHDATGASYYGSSSLYLVSADPSVPAATICSSGSDGVVHDAQWNPLPTRKEFAVICGRRAFICSGKTGQATLDFGMQGWNTLSWSPNGRFLMVGGFGNMPGNLWFFDRIEKLLLGTASDHGAKPIGWSSDGRSLLLARLHPWRRVDNGFRIYKYSGAVLSEFGTDKLYDVKFMHADADKDVHERPASEAVLKNAKPISAASLSEKKTQAYRPPKGRGTGSTGVNALLRQMRDQQDGGPRMVGASPVSMTEAEREAEKKLKEERKRKNKERKARKKQEQAEAAAAAAAKAEEEAKAAKQAAKDAMPPAKRAKALTKKLRQIEALKKKQTDGEELDEDQMEKLSREEELLSELKALGFSL